MRILFITANRIGDAILASGLLRHINAAYPEANITIVCGPLCTDLFQAVPNLERLIPLPKQRWNLHWLWLWLQCWPYRWDIIIDLRNSLVSRLLSHGELFTHGKNNHADSQHKVRQNAAIMRLAQPPAPKIWVSEADRAAAVALLGDRPVIALGPAANWLPKQWPPAFMAALVELFLADPALSQHRFLVMAAAHEQEQIAPVLAVIPPERLILQLGGSLAVAAACLEQCVLYIGNDSGLMHLAAAMGAPTVGLFGPGYPETYGPWGAHTAIVRTPESREELLAQLPFAGASTPNLMSSIRVEAVAEAAYALL